MIKIECMFCHAHSCLKCAGFTEEELIELVDADFEEEPAPPSRFIPIDVWKTLPAFKKWKI